MTSLATGTITVTQTQTVTYTSQHPQNTPHESRANPGHASPGAPPAPPPSPMQQEGYSYPMSPPPQPGFPFDPFTHPGQIPPPMVLPLGGGPPSYQAGAVMDPLTAVISIVVVAMMYWGFKNGTAGFGGYLRGGASSNVSSYMS